MSLITVLLALLGSVASSLGGSTGALITQLVNLAGSLQTDQAEVAAAIAPWITWANGIVDAGRNPTAEEKAAVAGLRDAAHAYVQAAAAGHPLPAIPAPPTA